MKQKRILILGGGYSTVEVVKYAKELGLYTIVTSNEPSGAAKAIADETLMYSTDDVDNIVKYPAKYQPMMLFSPGRQFRATVPDCARLPAMAKPYRFRWLLSQKQERGNVSGKGWSHSSFWKNSRQSKSDSTPIYTCVSVFSWQLCNEPRPFSDENKEDFLSWARESAAIIKSIDTNHLVSTGSEGLFGCEVDSSLFARLHSLEDIDYFNIHIWPYNWNWVDKGNLDSVDIAIDESRKYIGIHTDAVADAGKPLVIEEFGYPRDGFSFSKDSSVSARDIYYRYIFDIVIESARSGGCIAGCNFWAWGGYAGQSSESEYWRRGDDYCGDPAQEPQGLYSVYAGDSTTVELVRETNELIATATAGIEM